MLPCEPQTSPGLGEPNMGTWWPEVPSVLGPSWQQLRGMGVPSCDSFAGDKHSDLICCRHWYNLGFCLCNP